MDEQDTAAWIRRILLGFLLGGLLFLGYTTVREFLVPMAWAGILTHITWPLYRWLKRHMGDHGTASALVMTLFLTLAFVLPLLWLVRELQIELATAYQTVTSYIQKGPQPLPGILANIPWLGEWLQRLLNRIAGDMTALEAEIVSQLEYFRTELAQLAFGIGRFTVKLVLTLITVFFFYRDGDVFLGQVHQALQYLLGQRQRVNAYLAAIGDTTKGVVYSLVFSALAQGGMAGIGYWAAGLQAPLLLATFTTLIALLPIPFATPVVWASIGLWLLLNGHTLPGIGLLLWGTLVVSWVDNLVRPLVISGAAHIPFLLVLFGVIGGLTAFGLIGLFLGPVILAILLAVWREWLQEQSAQRREEARLSKEEVEPKTEPELAQR